jgi:glycosyltransferase involved in cell wall biosynthesis
MPLLVVNSPSSQRWTTPLFSNLYTFQPATHSTLKLPPLSQQPLVSIVTPSYNQAAYLEQTLTSVLDQDYPRLEYLVVDGASTDGSVEIIRRYAGKLAWWVSEKDSGQAEAINKGFSHARGEIVAWLNSDDYYLPGTISAVVRAFHANPEALLVYGDMQAVDSVGRVINLLTYRQLSLEGLLCFHIIGQPAVFMRRAALEQAGELDLAYHCMLDHQLWLRIVMNGEITHIEQTWSAARYHPAAKNRARAAEFGSESFKILEWALTRPELAPVLAKISRRARASAHRVDARYLLDGGHPRAALGAWWRAFTLHPPTALARPNIFISALLTLSGLSALRSAYLRNRRERLSR